MITRPKIGIAVSDINPSQNMFYLILEAADKHDKMDFIIFYEHKAKSMLYLPCASMQINEAWAFDGPIIATNILTAHKILQCPSPTKKFLYCWDLEWMRANPKIFNELTNIYRNKDLKLIVRGQDHKNLIEDVWNTKVDFVHENWSGVFENEAIIENSKEIPFLVYGRRESLSRGRIL